MNHLIVNSWTEPSEDDFDADGETGTWGMWEEDCEERENKARSSSFNQSKLPASIKW